MERGFLAPVCSTWSFLPSSLLAWAALLLLGNRLQEELLGLTPERQRWNINNWIFAVLTSIFKKYIQRERYK